MYSKIRTRPCQFSQSIILINNDKQFYLIYTFFILIVGRKLTLSFATTSLSRYVTSIVVFLDRTLECLELLERLWIALYRRQSSLFKSKLSKVFCSLFWHLMTNIRGATSFQRKNSLMGARISIHDHTTSWRTLP